MNDIILLCSCFTDYESEAHKAKKLALGHMGQKQNLNLGSWALELHH